MIVLLLMVFVASLVRNRGNSSSSGGVHTCASVTLIYSVCGAGS